MAFSMTGKSWLDKKPERECAEKQDQIKQIQAELKDKQLLINAHKTMNARLGKALEVAETFLRSRPGTVKVLRQIQRLKEGGY